MRALFVTSSTSDVDSLVRAWDCWQPDKSVRVMFPHMGQSKDDEILEVAREMSPDVIFYIGANEGSGIPVVETFLALRDLAPLINLCCDAGDWPWHNPLRHYEEAGCFDLQVALDGSRDAPVDLATVTPVDPSPYAQSGPRTVRCGFSGGVAPRDRIVPAEVRIPNRRPPRVFKKRPANVLPAWPSPSKKVRIITAEPQTARDHVIWNLGDAEECVTVRRRSLISLYSDHAAFMLSCQLIINFSATGTGTMHHIKGRVLEAGWAGCALLESKGSPIAKWLPEGSYFIFCDVDHARSLIDRLTDEEIMASAALLSRHVRENYHPRQIYGEILERAGLVDHSVKIKAP